MASAIAINTMVINLSRIIGPAIAGALIAIMDIAQLFYINAWGTLGVLILFTCHSCRFLFTPDKKERRKNSSS